MQDIDGHCREIARCNQRGGRMLSIADLLAAGTLGRDPAAYLAAAIGGGASFMVGASPGGAGKTTVMGALLNLVPERVTLLPADTTATIERGLHAPDPRCCYICHEIGAGPYYAYLWGQALQRFFELPSAGHMLATNLHADTCAEAHAQVCGQNRVPESAFRAMNLMLFLALRRGSGFTVERRIATVWESDGTAAHRKIYDVADGTAAFGTSDLVDTERLARERKRVDRLLESDARTIEEVRAWLLDARH